MKHKLLRWGAALAALLLILTAVCAVPVGVGLHRLAQRPAQAPDLSDGAGWYWQDAETFVADGAAYRPKPQIVTLLGIGLGSSRQREETGFNRGMQPMADTFVLAVLDRDAARLDLVSIPRDTQAPLDYSRADSPFPLLPEKHLALQYRYGGADTATCTQTTAETVSRLLYDAGIAAAVTIDMDSVVALADTLGGVPVTVPDDPWYCAYTGYTPGQWVLLDGPAALQFVQYRDLTVPGSCEIRVERQKLFVDAVLCWAKKYLLRAPWKLPPLYQALQESYYTDLTLPELAALAATAARTDLSAVTMHTLPGTVQQGEIYEEYHPDQAAVRRLLLELYYAPLP